MASNVRRAAERLFRPKHDYLPGDTVFRELDTDRIAREMELVAKGEQDGRGGVPRANSKSLTTTEAAIAKRLEGYWTEAVQSARRAHEAYIGRLTSLGGETDLDLVEGRPSDVAATLRELASSHADEIELAKASYAEARRDMEQFKRRERIERSASEPKTMGWRVVILMVAFALELFVNVGVFAEADEFGLAGALLKLIAIPPLNIGVSFFIIFLFGRQLWRPHLGSKIIGAIAFVVAITLAILFNLTIAHWRDAMSLQLSSEAGRTVIANVIASPLNLLSIESWVLFSIGCAAALLAMGDALIWHDPHPGYTTQTVRLNKARRRLISTRQAALDEIAQESQHWLEALTQSQRDAELGMALRPELTQRMEGLAGDLQLYRASIQSAADVLVGQYREANMRARTTDAPERFDHPLKLNLQSATLPPYRAPSGRTVGGRLKKAIAAIASAREAAISSLPTLENLAGDKP